MRRAPFWTARHWSAEDDHFVLEMRRIHPKMPKAQLAAKIHETFKQRSIDAIETRLRVLESRFTEPS
jgi:hypothetical protein